MTKKSRAAGGKLIFARVRYVVVFGTPTVFLDIKGEPTRRMTPGRAEALAGELEPHAATDGERWLVAELRAAAARAQLRRARR